MYAYLDSFRARYFEIREMGAGKNKALKAFWWNIRVGFWVKWTWEDVRECWGQAAESYTKAKMMQVANSVRQ